ncbi:UvrD-helicase domain-containing protein [soil metagenome]
MDAAELGRRRAADLHEQAASIGHDPRQPYAFVLAEAKRRGLDVEKANPGSGILDGGRATYVPADGLIIHENIGSDFDQAFLVAHELGHVELGDASGPVTVTEVDPVRPSEPSPVGFDRVVDYGRHQRREVQMDLFAREFLLPRALVRRLHIDSGLSASQIAAQMGAPFDVVSQQLLDALLLPIETIDAEKPHVERPLNDLQAQAAKHRGKAYLLEAGPGTGKTQTLTGRIEGLLADGVDPRRILVLTFSNKAAGEMAERVARKNSTAAAAMWMGTFHAFGLDIVRRFAPQLGLPKAPRMMDRTEAVELLEQEFPRLPLKHYQDLYDPTRNIADILSAISRAKDEVVDAAEYALLAAAMRAKAVTADEIVAGEKAAEVAAVYDAYERLKRQANCIDFGDLVSVPVRLLESDAAVRATIQGAYDHVLVDEYQDVNRSSVRLIEAICPNGHNLWVVGDAKQSIYRFRGASSFNTARFGKDDFKGGERGRLKRNYRSSKEVVDAFSAFAADMKVSDGDVALDAERGALGNPVELHAVPQADNQVVAIADAIEAMRAGGHKYRDQAVLCTGNERLSSIGRDLERLGIPVLFLGSLFERPEVKDLLAILSLLVDARAMGIVRVGALAQFELSLSDVAAVIEDLRGAEDDEVPGGWSTIDPNILSPPGQVAWTRLRGALAGFTETSAPWDVLASLMLDRTRIAADIATAESVSDRSRGIAIWQFMNFLRVQPSGRGWPVRRLLDRVRRLVRIGDDRDLRQLPAAAQSLDAVRLMTVHGAKGLEFPVVHLPGLNQDTLPGNAKSPACLPPDGMVAGGEGDALTVFRAGDAEERECLFYVAASRARDRLFLYAVTHKSNNTTRPLSPFLDRLGAYLRRRSITPARSLPPKPEDQAIDLRVSGRLQFTASQLSLYDPCPRRFFYTHVLQVGGRRSETVYTLMHEAVRSVTQAVVAGKVDIADDAELVRYVASACLDHGLKDCGVLPELQAAAVDMIKYFRSSRAGAQAVAPTAIRLTLDGDEIVFRAEDVLVAADGTHVFRRVRTGRIRSKEDSDVGAAALLMAAQQHGLATRVELIHLSDRAVTALSLTPMVLKNRRQTLSDYLSAIRAGAFKAVPSERTCPGCPAFFICGPVSAGALEIKF